MFGRRDHMKEAMKRYRDVIEKIDMTYYMGNGKYGDDKPEFLERFPIGQTALIFDYYDYSTYEDNMLAESNLKAIKESFSNKMVHEFFQGRYYVVKVKSHRRRLISYDIAEDIISSLEEYPVLDDDDYTIREVEYWQETFSDMWQGLDFIGMSAEKIADIEDRLFNDIEFGYYGVDYINEEKQVYPLLFSYGLCFVDCWNVWTENVMIDVPAGASKIALQWDDDNFCITYGYFDHSEMIDTCWGKQSEKFYNVAIPLRSGRQTMAQVSKEDICFVISYEEGDME